MTNNQKQLSKLALWGRMVNVYIPLTNQGIYNCIIVGSVPNAPTPDAISQFACDFEQDFSAWANRYDKSNAKDYLSNWAGFCNRSYESVVCLREFQNLCDAIRTFISWYYDFTCDKGFKSGIVEPMPEYADLSDFCFWTHDFLLSGGENEN